MAGVLFWYNHSIAVYIYSPEQTWKWTSGPYFIKVKIILNLRFTINLIFYLIKELMKYNCVNFFYKIVNKISIKVKRNSKFKEFAKT